MLSMKENIHSSIDMAEETHIVFAKNEEATCRRLFPAQNRPRWPLPQPCRPFHRRLRPCPPPPAPPSGPDPTASSRQPSLRGLFQDGVAFNGAPALQPLRPSMASDLRQRRSLMQIQDLQQLGLCKGWQLSSFHIPTLCKEDAPPVSTASAREVLWFSPNGNRFTDIL